MTKVTLKKIAKHTGLSVSTVSRALRGFENISPQTRKRVQNIYERLRLASDTKDFLDNRKRIIGVFSPADRIEKSESNVTKHIHVLQRTALNIGYTLMMGVYGDEGVGDRMIAEKAVDGIIITGSHIDDPIYERLRRLDIPFIVLHRLLPNTSYHYIGVDDRKAAKHAVEYLISKGHKEIGFISGSIDYRPIVDKLEGFKDALREHNLPINDKWILHSIVSGEEDEGRKLGLKLLELSSRPSAIFAATDETAYGVLEAARIKSINVPQQLAIMGFDNKERSGYTTPPLTTVEVPWTHMVELAVQSLIQIFEHKDALEQIQIKLKTKLVIRRSA